MGVIRQTAWLRKHVMHYYFSLLVGGLGGRHGVLPAERLIGYFFQIAMMTYEDTWPGSRQ